MTAATLPRKTNARGPETTTAARPPSKPTARKQNLTMGAVARRMMLLLPPKRTAAAQVKERRPGAPQNNHVVAETRRAAVPRTDALQSQMIPSPRIPAPTIRPTVVSFLARLPARLQVSTSKLPAQATSHVRVTSNKLLRSTQIFSRWENVFAGVCSIVSTAGVDRRSTKSPLSQKFRPCRIGDPTLSQLRQQPTFGRPRESHAKRAVVERLPWRLRSLLKQIFARGNIPQNPLYPQSRLKLGPKYPILKLVRLMRMCVLKLLA